MEIAILGASSQISKGLIKLYSKNEKYHLKLFVRDKLALQAWIKSNRLTENISVDHFDEFTIDLHIDLIINCVGVGDPSKLVQLGATLLETTRMYDDLAINYLVNNSNTKYIFFSSGAVYGDIFSEPAGEVSKAIIDLDFRAPSDFYTLSKLYAEARHRALSHLSIIDLRVFNYISNDLDIDGNFFISQLVKSLINKTTFATNSSNMIRDYIGPDDLFLLIESIIESENLNDSFDCYTRKPIDKFSILDFFNSEFHLNFLVEGQDNIRNSRENYYSVNYKAKKLGFNPIYSSLENIQRSVIDIMKSS
jgi:nucleoside-diphosphate-sugar epimerase